MDIWPTARLGACLLAAASAAMLRAQGHAVDPPSSWDSKRNDGPIVSASAGRWVEGEILVGLGDNMHRTEVLDAARSLGCELVGEVPRLLIMKFSCLPGYEPEAAQGMAHRPGVRFAELNGLGEVACFEEPGDPCQPSQWHLENDGSSGGKADADVDLYEAWSVSMGSDDVVVAILDTGIDTADPEFAGRLVPGYDFVGEDNDPTASPGNFHGTHLMRILGGAVDNGVGGTGVDQHCRLMPVKVLEATGSVFDLVQGLDFAASQGVQVINMSLQSYPDSEGLKTALAEAHDAGCILISAAGNGGAGHADTSWPGASPLTISVGMTDKNDLRAKLSATGAALDFMAPGKDVFTGVTVDGTDCADVTGTSFAAPLTSATAALLLAIRPDLTQDAVYALLAAGASDQIGLPEDDTPGWDKKYGYGRISAGASLRILTRMLGNSGMHSAPATITAEKGGRQLLVAQVGRAAAGSTYVVLGSVSGTVPGTILHGVTVPLVADRYFMQTMLGVGGLIDSSGGLVPTDGTILSVVSVPPDWHSAAELPGIAHAVLVPRPKFAEPFSSEPAILQIQD